MMSTGSQVMGFIVLFGLFFLWLAVKVGRYRSTRCAHCGHESGLSGMQAPICPACGRNKTIIKARRARRR